MDVLGAVQQSNKREKICKDEAQRLFRMSNCVCTYFLIVAIIANGILHPATCPARVSLSLPQQKFIPGVSPLEPSLSQTHIHFVLPASRRHSLVETVEYRG